MSNEYADQGTAAHWVLEQCLVSIYQWKLPMNAHQWIGQTIQIQDGPHADLSPSSSARWTICPASVGLALDYPEEISNEARGIEFTRDDANAVQAALDYVAERVKVLQEEYGPVTVRTEHRVSLQYLVGTDRCDGTCDIGLITDGFIEIADYKHGQGKPVRAGDPQLEFYLAGMLQEYIQPDGTYPFEHARRTVIQPRCDKMEPRIRSLDLEDSIPAWISAFTSGTLQAIERVDSVPPAHISIRPEDFNPSEEACYFCPGGRAAQYNGNPVCKAYADFALAGIGVTMPNGGTTSEQVYQTCQAAALEDTRVMPPAQLRGIMDSRELLSGMLNAVEAWAMQLLLDGKAPPEIVQGYKLVRGRSNRRWKYDDPVEMARMLKRVRGTDPKTGKKRALGKKELFLEKLDSPAGIETRMKALELSDTARKAFRALIIKPPGKLSIAPRSDPRTEVVPEKASAVDVLVSAPDDAPKIPGNPATDKPF